MSICTFFGHSDTPQEIAPILHLALTKLITQKNVDMFYVGNQGSFDRMVKKELQDLKIKYPHINYAIVLAYLPKNNTSCTDTVYPEGLETVPPKFAISKRNKWMLERADYVVTYVCYPFGGAAQFKQLAERRGKIVINLAE